MRKILLLLLLLPIVADAAANFRFVRQQAPASNTTQDYTISGFGTPQCAIVVAGIAGSGSDTAQLGQSIGFWDGTTDAVAYSYREDNDGVSPEAGDTTVSTEVVHVRPGVASGTRTATIANITDGIRLTWAGTTTTQPYVIVTLINGTNGCVTGWVTPAGTDTGTATESGLGITPKLIFGSMTRRNVDDGLIANKNIGFGIAYDNGTTYDQGYMIWAADANTVSTVNCSRIDNSQWLDSLENSCGGERGGIEVTDMASGSFEITSTGTNMAAHDAIYAAIDMDEDAELFFAQAPTTSGDWDPFTSSFTPSAVIMAPSNTDAINVRQTGSEGTFLGFYGVNENEEFGIGWADEDGAATSNTSGRTETSLFIQTETAGTPDIVASSPTFDGSGIVYADANVTDATIAYYILGVAIASASSTSIVPIIDTLNRRRRQ